MTQFATPGIGMNAGYPEGGDGWKAGADYNFVTTSIFLRRLIADQTTGTLPVSPAIGDAFIAGGTLVGPLIGKDKWLVMRGELGWHYLAPEEGWRFFDVSLGYWIQFDGTNWIVETVDFTSTGNLTIGTDFGPADIGGMYWALSGGLIVDMGGNDYTMTDEEAIAPAKAVVGVVAGKKLTWPTSAESRMAVRQFILMAYAGSDGLILWQESTGSGVIAPSGQTNVQLGIIPGVSISLETSRLAPVLEIAGTTHTVYPADCGMSFHYTNAAGCAVTIDSTAGQAGFWFEGYQMGAGQVAYASTWPIANVDGHTKSGGLYAATKIQCSTLSNTMVLSGRTGV